MCNYLFSCDDSSHGVRVQRRSWSRYLNDSSQQWWWCKISCYLGISRHRSQVNRTTLAKCFFVVGTFLGLMSAFLKAAKKSSQGAALYL